VNFEGNDMVRIFLQDILLDDISSSHLPYNWNSFNFENFLRKTPSGTFIEKLLRMLLSSCGNI